MKHSLVLLAIEHGTRLALDSKTRNELSGPFFRDYIDSVHIPRDWDDGDSVAVNYVGHPIHGAAAGYLYRDAAGVRGSSRFGLSPSYWATMGKSTAFIGVYSLQFEFGPLSEASIGNVGRHPATRGWVDHVVTPVMGFCADGRRGRAGSLLRVVVRGPRRQPNGARDHPAPVQPRAVDGQSGAGTFRPGTGPTGRWDDERKA
jgi:hypothetical protein